MKELFSNPTVVVPAIAWLIAQFLKFGVKAMKGDVSLKYFIKSGNMPSVHTAIVMALLVSVAFVEGVDSTFFGIALVLAMIVIYDALGVRRAVGEQGTLLERLLQLQKDRINRVTPKGERINLVEVLGHTPLEVAAGAAVGLTVSLLLMNGYWSDRVVDYFWSYGTTEKFITKIILVIVVLLSTAAYLVLKRRSLRKLPSSKSLTNKIAYGLFIPSLFGLFVIWANDVNLAVFESKIWLITVVFWMVAASVIFVAPATRNFLHRKESEARELRQARKQKRQKRRKK